MLGVFKYITDQVSQLLDHKKVIVRITYVDNLAYAENLQESIIALNSEKISCEISGILSAVISAHIGLGGMGIYLATE